MNCTSYRRTVTCVITLCIGMAFAQPAPFTLLSPSNNDSIRLKAPYFHWQSSSGAHHYELWVDNAKRGEVPADPATPTRVYFDSLGFAAGKHTWHVNAIDANNKATKSGAVFAFTMLGHPVLPYWAIGPFQKYGGNPILSPQGTEWEGKNVLNPGVVADSAGFHMLYRAQNTAMVSQLGYARGPDGVSFSRNAEPGMKNDGPSETKGCEDPRLVKLGDTFYCFYASYDGSKVSICVASSKNLTAWTKYGPKITGSKNACIVTNPDGSPSKINDVYYLYHGDAAFTNEVRLASSPDLITWTHAGKVNLDFLGSGGWEPCVALANASPNGDDIIMFFAGKLWGDQWFNPSNPKWYYYAISEVLLSKSNMLQQIDRLGGMILVPDKPYETNGQFNNCIFTNSVFKNGKTWWNHYGAGDSRVAAAFAPDRGISLGPNLAKGKTTAASSSVQSAGNAVDSSCKTRWESAASGAQWIEIDLGSSSTPERIVLKWHASYGKNYSIQVSENKASWTDVYSTASGDGGADDIVIASPVKCRYVRMNGAASGATGFSLWEFEVYGSLPVKTGPRPAGHAASLRPIGLNVQGNFIRFTLPHPETVTLSIYSVQGKLLASGRHRAAADVNSVCWNDLMRLPAGMYLISLTTHTAGSASVTSLKAR